MFTKPCVGDANGAMLPLGDKSVLLRRKSDAVVVFDLTVLLDSAELIEDGANRCAELRVELDMDDANEAPFLAPMRADEFELFAILMVVSAELKDSAQSIEVEVRVKGRFELCAAGRLGERI